ncbi:MAG TPA: serine hydrolase [Alphaproteobacteria bacterium]|nr:serine hydrolase [Alphaproteobacteria bacterium]
MTDPRTATLANWRTAPHSEWAFQHVDRLVAVEPIPRGPRSAPLEAGPPLDPALPVPGPDGTPWPLGRLLDWSHADGFLVLHRGRVAAERYAHGQGPETRHIVFSISKSVTGALAGILAARGQLDPDAPVSAYVPEVAGSAYADCTVRHVLDMTVSIRFVEDYLDPAGDVARYRVAMGWNPPSPAIGETDLRGFVAGLPRGAGPHGEAFHYVSPNSDLLGWILERAAGQPFAALMSEALWRPMGAEADGQITVDRLGAPRTAGGICVTLRDLARFGELMRLGGGGVVPAAWVEDIRRNGDRAAWLRGDMTDLLPEARYRSQWYAVGNANDAFCAIGIHGQWLYVDPTAELVIAQQSCQPLPDDHDVGRALLAAYGAVAAAVTGR